MPKELLERLRPDSSIEFRLAAQQRFRDGISLASAGRRTAAIYLWGYAVEMILKAAYFELIGFAPTQAITLADLRAAVASATNLGFSWIGNFHNLRSWSLLIVNTRVANPGWGYRDTRFGNRVMAQGRQLQQLWNETLRYHKNSAYTYEMEPVQTATEWFLMHASHL